MGLKVNQAKRTLLKIEERERGNMEELVIIRRNDAFTDSLTIAESTNNQHKSVVALIKSHRKSLEKFGRVEFSDLKSLNPKGGRPTKFCYLNEPQATLLITFLDNSERVVEFKTELVRQFYLMRKILAEKQTAEWIDTRKQGILIRKDETNVIQKLVEYAKGQGSEHANMLYMTYTKLANKMVGITDRETATNAQLNDLSTMERLITKVVIDGMNEGLNYKDIYKNSKERLETVYGWLPKEVGA